MEICGGNRCDTLIPLYEEVYSYGLNEKPNYGKLKFLLQMELVNSYCKPDKFFQFLQPSINFIGFINIQAEEDIGVSDDDMLEESIEVADTRDPNFRDIVDFRDSSIFCE